MTLQGNAEKDTAAESALAVGDVNGDGTNDLVIGSSQSDVSGTTGAGKVLILQGPISAGTYDVEAAAKVVVEGENAIETSVPAWAWVTIKRDGVADLWQPPNFWRPDEARSNAGLPTSCTAYSSNASPLLRSRICPQSWSVWV